jgi:hypothetical protein
MRGICICVAPGASAFYAYRGVTYTYRDNALPLSLVPPTQNPEVHIQNVEVYKNAFVLICVGNGALTKNAIACTLTARNENVVYLIDWHNQLGQSIPNQAINSVSDHLLQRQDTVR